MFAHKLKLGLVLGLGLGLVPSLAMSQVKQNYWQCVSPSAGVEASWCPVSASYPMPVSFAAGSGMLTSGANATSAALNNLATASGAMTLPLSGAGTFSVAGTTTSNTPIQFSAGSTSSNTVAVTEVNMNGTITPTGASLTNLRYVAINAQVGASTSIPITAFSVETLTNTLAASFAGTITTGYGILINNPVFTSGSTQTSYPTYKGYSVDSFGNGNGITTGTVTNSIFNCSGVTGAAGAGGTLVNNCAAFAVPSGSSAGNTDSAIKISGNGGAASTKFAIQSTSTALSSFLGPILSTNHTFTAAAPTVAAAQVGLGSTTAVVANCGVTGPTACLVINVAGTTRYVPYY